MELKETAEVLDVKRQANIVYRVTLPKNAGANQRRNFKRHVELMQRANPHLIFTPDWPHENEDEAFVVFSRDKEYNRRRVAYLVAAHLSRAFSGSYGG